MENKKISIIVPIYNVEKYLEQCLKSICNQDYKNLEIILVDDGSSDKSGSICDIYAEKDHRIKVIHKKNMGVSAARNSGLDIATGEYVCFADPDDYLEIDYISYLYNLIVENNCDISISKGVYDNYSKKTDRVDYSFVETGENATIDILLYKIHIGVYCKMFSMNFLRKYNVRFNEAIRMGEGFNFNTFCFQRINKVAIGNKQIYFYRQNNISSATTNFNEERWENGFFAIDEIERNLVIKSKKIINAINYARWHTYYDALFNGIIMGKENNSMFIKNCKKEAKRGAKYAFKVDVSYKEKIKAMIIRINPLILVKHNRKKIYKILNEDDN